LLTSIFQPRGCEERTIFWRYLMNEMALLPIVLKRNFWNALATFTSVIGASFLYLHTTTPLYQTSARLILDERQVSVSELGQALAAAPVPGNANPIATQAELITSKRVLERAVNLLSRKEDFQKPLPKPEEIGSTLQVKIVPATNILELNYKNADPVVAAKVLNAISEATVQESGESIRQEASSVRKFIESRIPQQEAKLERAEIAESQYKEANGIISIDTQSDSFVNSLTAVEDQERTLAAQLQEAQTRSGLLQRVTGVNNMQSAYIAARVGQDDELKALRTKLTDLETQVIDMHSRLGDQNPELLALIQKRDETRALYTQSLARVIPNREAISSSTVATDDLSRSLISTYISGEVERSAMSNKLGVLRNQQAALQARIAELPAKQQTLNTLTRQRQQEAEILKLMQNKLEEARVAEAQLVSNVRIIGLSSVPSSPATPKMLSVLVLGSVAGIASAIVIILLGEMLSSTIDSAADAKAQLKLSVISTLPSFSAVLQRGQLEQFLNNPMVVEPYRRLLKTLESQIQDQPKVILISSSVNGEGKSNVAARLAGVAAMLSRRTLLIDADLSHPLQHYFCDCPDQPGLTDAICADTGLMSVVQSTSIFNLDVLPHGQWLNRPAQILEADAMKTLIANATEQYDLVIIDASPASLYADVMTLSQYTRGVVLVVRPEFTPKPIAIQTVADLQGSSTPILGVVVNPNPDPAKIDQENLVGRLQSSVKVLLNRQPIRASAQDLLLLNHRNGRR
jgi:polysaccharide biosynthesis transport protein